MRTAAAAFVLLALAGCIFMDVKEQQEKIDATCEISGSLATERAGRHALVAVLVRHDGEQLSLADHFVLERPGKFAFRAGAGTYGLSAFEDRNDDLVYQPGEPLVRHGALITCKSGEPFKDIVLVTPERGGARYEERVDIAKLQTRSPHDQLQATLGQLSVAGEIAALSDARFSQAQAESGLWRPLDFLVDARAGIYFLEPYDRRKTPVLFVHGINGTPANFTELIAGLDRTRFQPWVYYYPSGAHLEVVADHLAQTLSKLQLRYDFRDTVVVAHSMGGLVARRFLQRYAASGGRTRLPLFVSIATPWDGHKGAAIGVATAPVVVRVWQDMAPGSKFLTELFETPLPRGTAFHMIFTRKDETVSLESELRPEALREAAASYGFDETHMGVLRNAEVSALLNRRLTEKK